MPLPLAAVAIASKVLGKLKGKAAKEREREANLHRAYEAAIQGFALPPGLMKGVTDPLKYLLLESKGAASDKAKLLAGQLYHDAQSKHHGSALNELEAGVTSFAKTPGGAKAIGAIATAAFRRSPTRRRSYIDQFGRRRTRVVRTDSGVYDEPPSQDDAGEAIDQGDDGQDGGFFTGDVSQLKGGKALGAAALVAGAGAGAYFVTKNLLDHMGAGARSRAEQGTQATLAFHQALEDYKAAHGAYPPPAERARMKNTWALQLAQIQGGQISQLYDRFISTYGDEEE